ncbi:hypothetical protein [Trueperella sp. LYQ143]|uniref:hypothetical protein n=1 Tax=unclassified Trueperella TaxID=2630174 RepID=UPI0039837D11
MDAGAIIGLIAGSTLTVELLKQGVSGVQQRRRSRRKSRTEMDSLHAARMELREYVSVLRQMMIEHGIDPPDVPEDAWTEWTIRNEE